MKQNVYNQPYNHHHHHQSNSTASSNNSNPSVNPPNYSSALKNNNNSNNNTNNSSGPRGGPTQQNKPQHTGYNNHRGSGGGGASQANQNSHGPSMNYTGGYQQSGNTGANPAGGPAPPPGHFDNQQYNYSQQAQYGGGKQQGQQFNQQGYNKPSATSENGPYYNKAAQHKQIHVTPPPNLVQQQQQQQHSQPHPQQQAPPASVSEPTPALTKQTSIEEPSTVKVVTPASIVVASSTAEITEKMSSMKIESKQPQVVEGEKKIDEPMNEPETSISPDIQQQQQQPTVIISQDQEFEPSRLCEVTGSCENGADNSEYYRNLVVAVDRLYPESKFPLHDTWTFGYIKNDPSAAR